MAPTSSCRDSFCRRSSVEETRPKADLVSNLRLSSLLRQAAQILIGIILPGSFKPLQKVATAELLRLQAVQEALYSLSARLRERKMALQTWSNYPEWELISMPKRTVQCD